MVQAPPCACEGTEVQRVDSLPMPIRAGKRVDIRTSDFLSCAFLLKIPSLHRAVTPTHQHPCQPLPLPGDEAAGHRDLPTPSTRDLLRSFPLVQGELHFPQSCSVSLTSGCSQCPVALDQTKFPSVVLSFLICRTDISHAFFPRLL